MRSKLKLARKSAGLKQEELAERIGVTKSFISYIESGRMNPSLNVAFDIAEILNIDIDETGKIFEAFQTMLRKMPIKDVYHIARVFSVDFDPNGIFKED